MPPNTLSSGEVRDLETIAAHMIPASEEYDVPGANDPAIIADILRSLGRDFAAVRAALADLAARAGGPLGDLDATRQARVAEQFLAANTADIQTLGRVVLGCYYRDDRVIRAVGLETRPPFPLGYKLEQGDWSLLDPVRARPKLWRDAP